MADNSSDIDDLREEYKNELIMLNATLKKLDKDMDFSDIIRPLLADTGPAVAHVPKLFKQIVRMKKYIDEVNKVRQEEEEKCSAATPCSQQGASGRGRGRRALSHDKDVVPIAIQPSWGDLKRYSTGMDKSTYEEAVAAARSVYDLMRTCPGGPVHARVKHLDTKTRGLITNNYLHFENIRKTALAGDFTMIHIGYYRNELFLAARAEKNVGRQNFIAWAVALLRARKIQLKS
jgi:hypothetical protein